MEVLLYSEQTDSDNGLSMYSSLYKILMPILKHLYQNNYSFSPLLFITEKEISYLDSNYPEENMLIKSLVKEDKLKILLGSFSNINPLLFPSKNIAEDIERMSTRIRKTYSKRPFAYFTYKNVISSVLSSSLRDVGIFDIYTAELKNADIRKGEFNFSDCLKKVRVHSPGFEDSFVSAISIDDVNEDIDAFLDRVYKTFERVEQEKNQIKDVPNLSDIPFDCLLFNASFLPPGCYNGKNKVNFLEELYSHDNRNLAYLFYIRSILLDTENRKTVLKNKKHLDYKMYELSDLSYYLDDKKSEKFKKEKEQVLLSLLEEFSSLSILREFFETTTELYNVLYSKNIFALISRNSVVSDLLLFSKKINLFKNGYAFKSSFIENNNIKTDIAFFRDFDKEKSASDATWLSYSLGIETIKEIHIRNASLTVKFSIRNNDKKAFIADLVNEFSFNGLTLDEKVQNFDVKNLHFKIGDTKNSLLLTSTKPFYFEKDEKKDENAQSLLIKPHLNIKLKKGETYDCSFTLKYEKGQGE